jgi:hypothetical protein
VTASPFPAPTPVARSRNPIHLGATADDFGVAVLAELPDVTAALLRDHVPDAGGWCRACGLPGTGTPHLAAPCSLRRIAEAARIIRIERLR